jgi:aryl-alcohol dehydrogenase-like predicted oxidoreductase
LALGSVALLVPRLVRVLANHSVPVQAAIMNTISLGGLTVSGQGLGCMGMSAVYGAADWEMSLTTIRRALDLGVTLIDTADAYGAGHNEVLVGRARDNEVIVDAVRAIADAKHVAPAQVALAWVYAQAPRLGVPVVPIPSTKRVRWLEQNAAALGVSLSRDDLAALDSLAARVVGGRY